jgi:hypothetical protein
MDELLLLEIHSRIFDALEVLDHASTPFKCCKHQPEPFPPNVSNLYAWFWGFESL